MIRLCRNSIRTIISSQRFSTITQEYTEPEPEINFVKLIGTVWEDSKRFRSDSLSCKVIQNFRTLNGTQLTCKHMLTIKPKIQKTSGIESLDKGHRINVNGYIRSIEFNNSSNKTRSAIAIIPHGIQLMHTDDPLPDMSFVIMTARIESKIFDDGKRISFNLRTHIPFRTDEDGFTGETTKHSHMIVLVDSNLQQYMRSHITQYDQIFTEGNLQYQSELLENGKRRTSGCIIPFHIEKI